VAAGELEVLEAGTGRRPALYRLPKAVGYVREAVRCAPETRAQDFASAPESGAQHPKDPSRSAPKTGAQENRSAPFFGASAPKTGAPPHTHKEQASGEASSSGQADAFQTCQPLIDAMTQAGITVSWSMQTGDWIDIAAIVQRAGVSAMVDFALKTQRTARQPIRYATFFLRGGWKGLPPAASQPPPSSSGHTEKPPHCGHTDCDPITRTRDEDAPNGLRVSVRCPDCHPNRKDQAA